MSIIFFDGQFVSFDSFNVITFHLGAFGIKISQREVGVGLSIIASLPEPLDGFRDVPGDIGPFEVPLA